MNTVNSYFLYKKPDDICIDKGELEPYFRSENFIPAVKSLIEDNINSQGFTMRLAVNDDIIEIENLIAKCFPEKASRDSNPYDFYRFISFGHGILVETAEKQLIGCVFEEPFDTPERTSYGLRLAIDKTVKSRDMGVMLVEYSSLLAMERGSGVKRSLIMADNFVASHIVLNKLGWIYEDYCPDLKWLAPSFTGNLPLKNETFATNRVDMKKLYEFLKAKTPGKDYLLTDWNDEEGFRRIYGEGKFVICSIIKPEFFFNPKHQFVSLPVDSIKLG